MESNTNSPPLVGSGGIGFAALIVMKYLKQLGSLLLVVALLTACGASKSKSQNAGSSGTTPWGAPVGDLAECNQIGANSFGLGGVVSSYFDQSTHNYRDDLGRIYLKQVPADIATISTKYLQIFRWQLNTTTGQPVYQTTPLSLTFILRSTGQVLNYATPVSTLSLATITNAITTYGLGAYGVNASNFFQFVVLIANGLSLSDNAYQISYFDSVTSTTTPIATANILMPPFYANPAKYQQYHPYSALYSLHPFNGMGTGLPESTYVNASLGYCQEFF